MLAARVIETSRPARSAAGLFAGVALSAMGYTILVAVVPLAAEDLLGSPRWSGVPSALGTVGTAFGAASLAGFMSRHGQRQGLVLGYLGASVAAIAAAFAASSSSFPILAVALFGIGAGYAASRLSRYAAAELYEPSRRSAAIGWNVWAATAGSVAGPMLLSYIARSTEALHLPREMGPFLVTTIAFAAAGFAVQFFLPRGEPARTKARGTMPSAASVPARGARPALASLVAGQVVMVLIMTMTPIHIRNGGHGLHTVGTVIASHTFGMYAFSPVAGFLSDRLGRIPMIAVASALLSSSALLAAAAGSGSSALPLALFLIGLGWNFSFVSASALLAESAGEESRLRLAGRVDALVWGSAAVAGVASGFVVAELGYTTLSRIGAVLALTPLLFLPRLLRLGRVRSS
jgi:MFS family permease